MGNFMETSEITRKTNAVYGFAADVTFEFKDGSTIRINKAILAFHTDFLTDVFFGSTPASEFRVENFDRETFKTFLDCLFGVKKYSMLDSLLIYPIAHHYQVDESMKKCVWALKPKVMDENVPLILNLAVFYENQVLVDNVKDFIRDKYGLVNFIENTDYRDLLEPKSIYELVMGEIFLTSLVWNIIYEWGKSYLEKNCKPVDIVSFFKETGFFAELELHHFESIQAVVDFHEKSDMQLFNLKTIFRCLQEQLNPDRKLPDKSEWVKLDENTFCETIKFSQPLGLSVDDHEKGLVLKIGTNKFFFEKFCENDKGVLNVKVTYFFRRMSLNVSDVYDKRHKSDCSCSGSSNPQHCICFIPFKISSFSERFSHFINVADFFAEVTLKSNFKILPDRFQELESVVLEYNFDDFCRVRILKTSLNENFKDSNKLYFTKSLVVSGD